MTASCVSNETWAILTGIGIGGLLMGILCLLAIWWFLGRSKGAG